MMNPLLVSAWTRVTTSQTGASGFSTNGIFPLKVSAVPEHAFLTSNNINQTKVWQKNKEK